MNQKHCSKCDKDLDISEFSKNSQAKDGYNWTCKACHTAYRYKKAESSRVSVSSKICAVCHMDKPVNQFSKKLMSYDSYNRSCKVCDSNEAKRISSKPKIFVDTKVCAGCKQEKDRVDFYAKARNFDGLASVCKCCATARYKARLKVLVIHKVSSKICSVCLETKPATEFPNSSTSPDGLYTICKACKNEKIKLYVSNNREKVNNARKHRYQTNLNFKLSMQLRGRLNIALKKKVKGGSAVHNLGCSLEELKVYLESKFSVGMTWENWKIDGWHIDHIIPLSKFNLTDSEEFLKACHYTNLQPLWAKENYRKGNR